MTLHAALRSDPMPDPRVISPCHTCCPESRAVDVLWPSHQRVESEAQTGAPG